MIYTELMYYLIHLLNVGLILKKINHRFFECSRYLNIRTTFFNNLNWLPTDCNVVSRLVTCGNDKLTHDQNVDIFNDVFEYIRKSKLFLNV